MGRFTSLRYSRARGIIGCLDSARPLGYTGGMAYALREFRIEDYDEAVALWKESEGIGLSEADSSRMIAAFLARNPGTCFVAAGEDGRLLGAILAGSDGRRGYLHHLAVARDRRGEGIGSALVARSLAVLAGSGIRRCHIFVMADNEPGRRFWERIGWRERTSLVIMSRDIGP
jgi:ribosomal protein S18 acetylase RimI-like enzyme